MFVQSRWHQTATAAQKRLLSWETFPWLFFFFVFKIVPLSDFCLPFFFKILHSTHACRCWNCFIITMHHPWFMFYILICPLSSIIPSRPVSSRGPSFKESVLLSIHLLFSRFCVVSVASSVTYVTCVSSSLHSPAMSLFFHYHIPEKSPAAPLPRVYPYATVKYFVIIRLLPFL